RLAVVGVQTVQELSPPWVSQRFEEEVGVAHGTYNTQANTCLSRGAALSVPAFRSVVDERRAARELPASSTEDRDRSRPVLQAAGAATPGGDVPIASVREGVWSTASTTGAARRCPSSARTA